jgi:hypothetical protein
MDDLFIEEERILEDITIEEGIDTKVLRKNLKKLAKTSVKYTKAMGKGALLGGLGGYVAGSALGTAAGETNAYTNHLLGTATGIMGASIGASAAVDIQRTKDRKRQQEINAKRKRTIAKNKKAIENQLNEQLGLHLKEMNNAIMDAVEQAESIPSSQVKEKKLVINKLETITNDINNLIGQFEKGKLTLDQVIQKKSIIMSDLANIRKQTRTALYNANLVKESVNYLPDNFID